jgi:hypothetical protein
LSAGQARRFGLISSAASLRLAHSSQDNKHDRIAAAMLSQQSAQLPAPFGQPTGKVGHLTGKPIRPSPSFATSGGRHLNTSVSR